MKKYIFKYKGLFIVAGVLKVITAGISVACSFMLQYMIDLACGGDINKFARGVIFFILFCLTSFLVDLLFIKFKSTYSKKTIIYLRNDIMKKLMKKNMKEFGEENSSKYISILSNDINMIEQDGINTLFSLIYNAFSFVIALGAFIYMNIYITISIFIIGGLAFFIPLLFSKKISKRRENYSKSLEQLTSSTKDILVGFDVIKSFNIVSKIAEKYSNQNNEVAEKKYSFEIFNGTIDIISENISTLLVAAPVAIGGYFVITGDITPGTMVALIQLIGRIAQPIWSSSQIINKIKTLKPIFNKIENITTSSDDKNAGISMVDFTNNISLENVNFSYDGEKKILKDINIRFEKGKKYALVGGSGSGKSTILKLLLRYYEEFDGNIFIDGKEHRDINIDDIYDNMSVIQQNVFMFDGTIKDNIGLYGDYTDEEIIKAANMAGLSKLIEGLSKGIYESVGENGSKLSGGEKQRVAIARAIIKNTKIMLLDESTSALDNETAYNIEKSLLQLEEVTSIVITHKFMDEILKSYDEIIVMKNGHIVEKGEFSYLLNNKGYFYSLYNVSENNQENVEGVIKI